MNGGLSFGRCLRRRIMDRDRRKQFCTHKCAVCSVFHSPFLTDLQHQASQAAIRQQNRNQPPQQQRMNNGGLQRPPGAMPPNGVGPTSMPGGQVGMPNGVQGHMGFPMSNPSGHPPNGAPGAPGGPQQQQHIQHMMSGQRPMGMVLF